MLTEVHWEVTNACNLRCTTCLPMSGKPRADELTTGEALGAIDLFHQAGVKSISFTGGEPFVRTDLMFLLDNIVTKGIRASVITNATLCSESDLRDLSRLNITIGVSLDGATEAINDKIRGKGTFIKILTFLRTCQVAEVPVDLYVTIHQKNLYQLDRFLSIAQEFDCQRVHFNELTMAGRAVVNAEDLAISENDRLELSATVKSTVQKIFNENLTSLGDDCWVDGTVLYMCADGRLYLCSEVFQQRPELSVGNIRQLTLLDLNRLSKSDVSGKCCYGVLHSEHATLVYNTKMPCLLPPQSYIETLEQLYAEFDEVYKDIQYDCRECQDPDCMGYIWLLESETDELLELGVPIVEVNNGPNFIHSFPLNDQGVPDMSVRYPVCSQRCSDGSCGIYTHRPLVCRLYPLGLETEPDGTIVWALHLDCLHVRRLEDRGELGFFRARLKTLLGRLSEDLLSEILTNYRAVDALSTFPDGGNNYTIVKEVLHHEQV